MPELPEVENVRRGLQEILKDQPLLNKIEFYRQDLRWPFPVQFLRRHEGKKILSVQRRAKYLLFETEAGYIISHLGMTGSWRIASGEVRRPHDHVSLHFLNGLMLSYHDPRRFGFLDHAHSLAELKHFKNLGPEPFDPALTPEVFLQHLRSTGRPIKVAIMEPKLIVGVGNIYASEALFRAGIGPTQPAKKLSAADAKKLLFEIQKLLRQAIQAGGSSISDYVQADGANGRFQDHFKVYDREGLPCLKCRTPVRRKVLSGRSTFYCPKCQR